MTEGTSRKPDTRNETKYINVFTCSKVFRMSSASTVRVTCASIIILIPWTYLLKLLLRAASTGALSTGITLEYSSGYRNAIVMATFAPLDHLTVGHEIWIVQIYQHGMPNDYWKLEVVCFQKLLDVFSH